MFYINIYRLRFSNLYETILQNQFELFLYKLIKLLTYTFHFLYLVFVGAGKFRLFIFKGVFNWTPDKTAMNLNMSGCEK